MKETDYSRVSRQRGASRALLTSISTRLIPADGECGGSALERAEVIIGQGDLQGELKCYDWRMRTEFPIIKILDYRSVRREGRKTILSIRYQNYPIRLSQLKQIPLFKILYLLKESVIAFERLYDRFGPFPVTPRMIAVSHQNKCKVWLNEDFASNELRPLQMEERQFLQSIYKIFLEISNKLKNTIHFFRELCQFNSFCQVLAFIESYARQNKISIQNTCRITQKELAVVENKPHSTFNPSLTMTRSPKFLNSTHLRSSLKATGKVNFEPFLFQTAVKEKKEQKGQSPDNLNMKTSGDTAADIYGSNTLSFEPSGEKEQFDESIIFGEVQKEVVKPPITSLQFSKSIKKTLTFTRQLSDFTPIPSFYSSTSNLDKAAFVPNFKSYRQVESESEEEGENKAVFKESVANIFQKNKWEKTLSGLFAEDNDMKKSTQHGQEKRRESDLSSKRLYLLEKVSMDLHESFMNEEEYPLTSQF